MEDEAGVLDGWTEEELETDFLLKVLNEPICQYWPSKALGFFATYFLHDSMGLRVSPVTSFFCMGQPEAA
jgi:hypothetical protein